VPPPRRQRDDPRSLQRRARRTRLDSSPDAAPPADGEPESIGHSAHEVLRTKDFAAMSPQEQRAARALISSVVTDRPMRRSRRLRAHRRGAALDLRAMARASVGTGGDPVARRFRRRTLAPRKLVLLCDVSGSMEAYTRALLLYLHATVRSGRGVEVFAFGTRLTRLTPELASRDPEQALAPGVRVAWSTGRAARASARRSRPTTTSGAARPTRGAVVLVVSDGWESEDHELVGREMARLHRAAYAVVWVNPARAARTYEPLAAGDAGRAASIDRFVSGHNVASLEALAGPARADRSAATRPEALTPTQIFPTYRLVRWYVRAVLGRREGVGRWRCSAKTPAMLELVDEDAELEQIGTGFTFTEGPLWNPDGFLLFSDMPGDVRRRWDEENGVTELANPSNKGNGMTFDNEGRLLVCEHVTSSLVRMDPDGTGTGREVLASHYDGRELNSPNDVIVKSDGAIYFSDPTYGRMPGFGLEREQTSRSRASTGSPPTAAIRSS
jgi:uncharacterized protein with von Willebrand factor type A (vWA) domain